MIILQTVLEEVKHRSSTIYKRLREIINDSNRKFYVFVNEHRRYVNCYWFVWTVICFFNLIGIVLFNRETYIEREPGESINDRNDKAIRTAALWYQLHLGPKNIKSVLLSEDAANREKAVEMDITALSCNGFFLFHSIQV